MLQQASPSPAAMAALSRPVTKQCEHRTISLHCALRVLGVKDATSVPPRG
jgi:hypothetical protein